MKPATHMRRDRNITDLESGNTTTYGSLNLAKQASHRIQMEQDKALGRGSMRVMDPPPKHRRRRDKGGDT